MMDLDRPALSRPMTTPTPAEGLSSLAAELADIRRGYEARCPGVADVRYPRDGASTRAGLTPDPES